MYIPREKNSASHLSYDLPSFSFLFIDCSGGFHLRHGEAITLQCRCCAHEPVVYAAAYAEEQYAGSAEGEGCACGAVALERCERCVGLIDVHALHYLQIVVE